MHANSGYFDDVLDAEVRCIVTERWKLVVSRGDSPGLYDLTSDPFEMRNVFHEPENRETVAQLYQYLQQWQAETNDGLHVPDPLGGQ